MPMNSAIQFYSKCDDNSYSTDYYLHVGGWRSTDIWVDRMCAFKEFKISQMFKSCTMGPKIAFIRLQPNPASSEATVQSSDQTDHHRCTWGYSCQAVDLGIFFTESEKGCGLEIPRCTIQTNCGTIINHADRVAKCNFFYTKQILWIKFYPKKSA